MGILSLHLNFRDSKIPVKLFLFIISRISIKSLVNLLTGIFRKLHQLFSVSGFHSNKKLFAERTTCLAKRNILRTRTSWCKSQKRDIVWYKLVYCILHTIPSCYITCLNQQWKYQNNVWHLFKVINKHTRKTSLTLFWCLYYQLETDFTRCPDFSIVVFQRHMLHTFVHDACLKLFGYLIQ